MSHPQQSIQCACFLSAKIKSNIAHLPPACSLISEGGIGSVENSDQIKQCAICASKASLWNVVATKAGPAVIEAHIVFLPDLGRL